MTDVTDAAARLRRLLAAQLVLQQSQAQAQVEAQVHVQAQAQAQAQAQMQARQKQSPPFAPILSPKYYNEYLQIFMKNAVVQQQQQQQLENNNLLMSRILADQQQQQQLMFQQQSTIESEKVDPRLRLQRQSGSSQSLLSATGTERSLCQEGISSSVSSPASSSFSPSITVPTVTLFNGSKSDNTSLTGVNLMDYGSDTTADTVAGPNTAGGEMLVPSNDKEGWCRNKKYIQIVKKGYRCTVCNKVYGRYNSVSYHVTIYHRNPPIRCEQDGCQFTTREARYIHFHKYYRHQIPLPESIDLASRKCPLVRCKHVSKSPAMLEKHLQRHVVDCLRDGSVYECAECTATGATIAFQALSYEAMFEHLRAVHTPAGKLPPIMPVAVTPPIDQDEPMDVAMPRSNENEPCGGEKKRSAKSPPAYFCPMCSYRGRTASNLEQHKVSKHSNTTSLHNGIIEEPTKCTSDLAVVSPIAMKSPQISWTGTTRLEDLTNYANIAHQQEQQRQQFQRLYELQLLQAASKQQTQAQLSAALGGVQSSENFMRALEHLLSVQKALFASTPTC